MVRVKVRVEDEADGLVSCLPDFLHQVFCLVFVGLFIVAIGIIGLIGMIKVKVTSCGIYTPHPGPNVPPELPKTGRVYLEPNEEDLYWKFYAPGRIEKEDDDD